MHPQCCTATPSICPVCLRSPSSRQTEARQRTSPLPLVPSAAAATFLLSAMWLWLLEVLYLMYIGSHGSCLFVPGLVHFAWHLQDSPHSTVGICHILLTVHWWTLGSGHCEWIRLLWAWVYKYLFQSLLSTLLCIHPEVEFLGEMVMLFFFF